MTRSLLRTVARHHPVLPFRGRLPLLNGRFEEIPPGELVTTREGVRVRVAPDPTYHNVYFWGDYEPYHTKIYRRIVRPGDVVFDVGANFGWYSTLFARWVGAGGQVHSFEPVPFIRELTAETIALNAVTPRVQLNPFGLGRENAEITIFTYAGLPHSHATMADLAREDAVAHDCRIRRLDDYCCEHAISSFRFMKVDVEGAELDVFLGGERVLSCDDAPIIAFELNPTCLGHRSLRGADVLAALRGYGYTEFFSFSTRTGVRSLADDDLDDGDLLAVKPSRIEELAPALRTGRLLR